MSYQRRIANLTAKSPLLGPIIWILSVQYFLAQIVVASAWNPAYSWATNLISDLGNTACGHYADRYVCSPQHGLMNASFVLLGLMMTSGALLLAQEFQRIRAAQIGFTLMALAGVGTVLVGLFAENTIPAFHFIGALLGLVIGNISLVVLAFGLPRVQPIFRVYTLLSGLFSLTMITLFQLHIDIGLGFGTVERLAGYPQTVWLITFGIYTSVRARAHQKK